MIDSAMAAGWAVVASAGGGFDPAHHVEDGPVYDIAPWFNVPLPFFLTKHSVLVIIAGILCYWVFTSLAKKWATVPATTGQRLLEPVIIYVRDEIVLKNIHHGEGFTPFFLTLFFFILFCNLLGALPWGGSATGNYFVTGALAAVSFLAQPVVGIYKQGPVQYFNNIVPPMPFVVRLFMYPVVFVLECIGLVVKPFALAIRLYANMMAGHLVLFSIFALLFTYGTWFAAVPVTLGVVAISVMELFVAVLQAYIFTMISAIIIGAAAHPHH